MEAGAKGLDRHSFWGSVSPLAPQWCGLEVGLSSKWCWGKSEAGYIQGGAPKHTAAPPEPFSQPPCLPLTPGDPYTW